MSIQGTKSEKNSDSFKKNIGMAEYKVVCFNPTREKLTEMLGTEQEKDPEYLGEKNDITTLRVNIWLKEVITGKFYSTTIFLEDLEVLSKVKEESPNDPQKWQYINARGRTMYAISEYELSSKFKSYPFHKARVGEADLTNFLDAWLDMNRRDDYSLTPDWGLLMRGNLKEFDDLIRSDLPRTITAMAIVRVSDRDGETKEYQSVYTRKWLPGFMLKHFRMNDYNSPETIKLLREKKETASINNKSPESKKVYLKDWEYYVLDVTDPNYGSKDIYSLKPLREYSPVTRVSTGDSLDYT